MAAQVEGDDRVVAAQPTGKISEDAPVLGDAVQTDDRLIAPGRQPSRA
jgi:hypothetical protein